MIRRFTNLYSNISFLKNKISNDTLFNAISQTSALTVEDDFESGKVLVLAPHPDDDVLGAGCAIIKHTERNDSVKIIFLTDGQKGFMEMLRPTSSERQELSKVREIEAKESAKIMGVEDIDFWRYPDGNLSANKTVCGLLKNVLNKYRPDIIYTPWLTDTHPDHFETVKALAESLAEDDYNPIIYAYEIWSPIFANKILKSDMQFQRKIDAIKAHRSQLKSRGYLEAFIGLAKYRAGMNDAGEYAEAFFKTDSRNLIELFKLIEK